MDDDRRRNCSKEEGGGIQDYSTLDNYTTDDDNNDRGKITQQSNSLREMEWMMMEYQVLRALWFPPFLGGTMVSAALGASSDQMTLKLCLCTQIAHASPTHALEQFPWLKFPYECCITTLTK